MYPPNLHSASRKSYSDGLILINTALVSVGVTFAELLKGVKLLGLVLGVGSSSAKLLHGIPSGSAAKKYQTTRLATGFLRKIMVHSLLMAAYPTPK
jgi:hypothetical protein